MSIFAQHSYRLVPRGGEGLACDKDGLALGAVDLARVRLDARGVRRCEVLSADEIGQILRTAYGPQPDGVVLRLHRGLRRAAASIEAGDLGRAGVEAVTLGFPDLTPGAMAKLAEIADLEKRNMAWETEPRIPRGQAGGGQWTTDGGGAPTAAAKPAGSPSTEGARRERIEPRRPLGVAGDAAVDASVSGDGDGFSPADRDLLVPVSTAATAVGVYGPTEDVALPNGVARLGRAGLLAFGAALLDDLDARGARNQVAAAVARFGLNPSRPADVMAASAYVWSNYALPILTQAPFRGPALDAASQAVMRFVLVNPGAFVAMRRDVKSSSLIIAAANAGLADYASESRARPAGVDPALQTNSARARKAIAIMLQIGRWEAHHLVPVKVWDENADIARLANKAGWKPDAPSNLIALPKDESAREELGGYLPLHNGTHIIYNNDARERILFERSKFPPDPSPMEARAILDSVASYNRRKILSGGYGRYIKVIT
jgi:hypothetical protein